jgi:hypothetical protein
MDHLGKSFACLAAVLLLLLMGAPSQAAPSSDPYYISAQAAVGTHSGTIYWDSGTNGFHADLQIRNADACEGHHTNAMFKLEFKDGSTAMTHFTQNPSIVCDTVYKDFDENYSQSKRICGVTPRVCHIINGTTTDCHLDNITYINPNVGPC